MLIIIGISYSRKNFSIFKKNLRENIREKKLNHNFKLWVSFNFHM
jgi:hypothetical protein